MIHPATEVRHIGGEKGYGLFATRFIPKGTMTWVRDQLDRELTTEQLNGYDPALREVIIHYSYRNNRGNYIFCWDNARYMNHDANFNTCITAYSMEIAIRDIEEGEEVTNHYGMLNIIEPFTLPEPDGTTIRPDDLLIYAPAWDKLLKEAFPTLTEVDQPLKKFLSNERWLELARIGNGVEEMVSVASCLYPGQPADYRLPQAP